MAEEAAPSRNGSQPNQKLDLWKERYKRAAQSRRKFEKDWRLCEAFLQGKQWVGWHTRERRVVQIPNPHKRERHTYNVMTSYLWTIMGKIAGDDFRPNIYWRREDQESVRFAAHADRAVEWAWDEELEAELRLMDAFLSKVTYGTSALRVRPDLSGPVIGEFPVGPDGQPITDEKLAYEYVSMAQQQGMRVQFQEIREARLVLDPLTPFNMLTPPGVHHERDFPWIVIEQAVDLAELKSVYGAKAAKLTEERLRSHEGVAMADPMNDRSQTSEYELREHAILKMGFERPTREFEKGRCIYWAQEEILEEKSRLPFEVNGVAKAGIVFFKHHPVKGRFWAQGAMQPLLGPQRQRNRAATQRTEMKDRNLGRIYVHQNALVDISRPHGGIMEVVEIRPGAELPRETEGVPVGPWIQQEVEIIDRDMDRIAGIGVPFGANIPTGATAYATFALFAEEENRRAGPVLKMDRLVVVELVKVILDGIRRYWPPEKQIPFEGENGMMDAFIFNAAKMPAADLVKVGKGAALPQSQAAEMQFVFDIFDRSISSGQPLPLDWLYESKDAGKALPLPKRELQVMQDKAELENMLLLRGQWVEPAPYDNDELHVQIHTQMQAQIQLSPGMEQAVQALEQHKMQHLESARRKASQVGPAGPGGPSAGPVASLPEGPRIGNQARNQQGFGPLAASQASGGVPVAT